VAYSLFLIICFNTLFASDSQAEEPCPHPSVTIIDSEKEEPVFIYNSHKCTKEDVPDLPDYPDSPAMAFISNDDQGDKVVLFNGIAGSYPSIGPSLDDVKRNCKQPLFKNNPDPQAGPEQFHNQTWLRDPWTADG